MSNNKIISILVLGGTGKTGRLVVEQALKKGLHVTALARHPEKFKELRNQPNLEILRGDVLHYPDVYNAVQGNDAVISALGRDGKNVEVLTRGTANVIRAISQSSVKKLICLSSIGAGSTKKLSGWKLRAMIWIAGLRQSFDAKAEQEILLYQSTVDFTLIMAGTLKDGLKTQQTQSFLTQEAPCFKGMPPKINRLSVAAFMIELLSIHQWKRKTICVIAKK
ncbi:SDR family oxidoreductase [soil metagenome]